MIIDYNAPNKVMFNQSNLGSYYVMTFKWVDVLEDSPIGGVQEFFPNDQALQEFMDSMISNMQYLGDDYDLNILLPGFYCIHCEIHSKFECPCCQDAISRVLSKVAIPLN